MAPIKRKFIRANQTPFISKLRNKFLKSRSLSHKKAYNKRRNACVSLLRKTKKQYYSTLNVKNIVDNKKFWKTVKMYFSDKSNNFEKIFLIEQERVITSDSEFSKMSNVTSVTQCRTWDLICQML